MHTDIPTPKKRIYRSQSEAVIAALWDIYTRGYYADKVIERVLKQDRRRGSADRAFIADTVYGMVRYRRMLMYVCGIDHIDHVSQIWTMMAAYVTLDGGSLPPWEEFAGVDTAGIKKRHDAAVKNRVIRESIPDWMDEIGMEELPDVWDEEIHALNIPAEVVLRVNTIKASVEETMKSLAKDGVHTRRIAHLPHALELEQRKNVFDTQAFRAGCFEVQDASSQAVAELLAPAPGMRVVDACAGAGGKTLHMAALMENKGSIISMDIYPRKLEELKKRARRAGVSNVTTRVIEGTKTIKRMANTADRLLLDVPCSGMGTLRRNPDAKWKLTPQFVDEITQTQAYILDNYSRMLRVGGRMVYATCSILPRENRRQVDAFLEKNDGYRLIEDHAIFASRTGYDGFYMALMERIK